MRGTPEGYVYRDPNLWYLGMDTPSADPMFRGSPWGPWYLDPTLQGGTPRGSIPAVLLVGGATEACRIPRGVQRGAPGQRPRGAMRGTPEGYVYRDPNLCYLGGEVPRPPGIRRGVGMSSRAGGYPCRPPRGSFGVLRDQSPRASSSWDPRMEGPGWRVLRGLC